MFCHNCGTKLDKKTAFCHNCGVKQEKGEAEYVKPQNLIGFSERYWDPSIIEAAKKHKRTSVGCMWSLVIIPVVGFILAGILIKEFDVKEAIIIGVSISVVMLIINLFGFARSKKPIWEGQVIDKSKKERQRHRNSGDDIETYTEYTTVIRTASGKKKTITERDSQRHMYDYLKMGDRVRYYPVFDTFEKYDKSKDKIIYCNVCSMMNPISNEKCKRCNNLLFK